MQNYIRGSSNQNRSLQFNMIQAFTDGSTLVFGGAVTGSETDLNGEGSLSGDGDSDLEADATSDASSLTNDGSGPIVAVGSTSSSLSASGTAVSESSQGSNTVSSVGGGFGGNFNGFTSSLLTNVFPGLAFGASSTKGTKTTGLDPGPDTFESSAGSDQASISFGLAGADTLFNGFGTGFGHSTGSIDIDGDAESGANTIGASSDGESTSSINGTTSANIDGDVVAPVAPTVAPVPPTVAPVTPTTAPVTPTTAPVTPTTAPVTPTTAPVTPTAAPVTPTVAPVTPTVAPVTRTVAPVTPTVAPVTPTVAPVTPTVAPVTPTVAPVTPTVAPVTPTVAPVTPTVAPVTPTVAPVTPTQPQQLTYTVREDLCQPYASIASTGTPVVSNGGGQSVTVPFPFFAFGGTAYTSLRVRLRDGYVSLDNSNTNFNAALPIEVNPGAGDASVPRISLFQDNFSGGQAYEQSVTSPQVAYIISMENVDNNGGGNADGTGGQIVLYPSGDFELRWGALVLSAGTTVSAGIEDETQNGATPAVLGTFFNSVGIATGTQFPTNDCLYFQVQTTSTGALPSLALASFSSPFDVAVPIPLAETSSTASSTSLAGGVAGGFSMSEIFAGGAFP